MNAVQELVVVGNGMAGARAVEEILNADDGSNVRAFRLADGHCTTGERSVQAYQVTVEDGEVVLQVLAR